MRRHRVRLSPPLTPGERRLSGPAAHHLLRVLRLRPGAELMAFDGEGHEAAGRLLAVEADAAVLALEEPRAGGSEAGRRVVCAVALLKGDKLAEVVRMGTELGVAAFQPLLTRRADVTELSAAKLTRLRRVASEAARQCGRAVVPEVQEAVPLGSLTWTGRAMVATPEANGSWTGPTDWGDDLTVVTGPEGGLTEDEVEALTARGASAVDLGPRILRAETAPVAIASALLLGDRG